MLSFSLATIFISCKESDTVTDTKTDIKSNAVRAQSSLETDITEYKGMNAKELIEKRTISSKTYQLSNGAGLSVITPTNPTLSRINQDINPVSDAYNMKGFIKATNAYDNTTYCSWTSFGILGSYEDYYPTMFKSEVFRPYFEYNVSSLPFNSVITDVSLFITKRNNYINGTIAYNVVDNGTGGIVDARGRGCEIKAFRRPTSWIYEDYLNVIYDLIGTSSVSYSTELGTGATAWPTLPTQAFGNEIIAARNSGFLFAIGMKARTEPPSNSLFYNDRDFFQVVSARLSVLYMYPPTGLSPNNTNLSPGTIRFSWNETGGDTYDVEIYKDQNTIPIFTTVAPISTTNPPNSFSRYLGPGNYSWRVRASYASIQNNYQGPRTIWSSGNFTVRKNIAVEAIATQ